MSARTRSTALHSETAITIVGSEGRISLRRGEAARALGISDEAFSKHVAPYVRCARLGSLQLYAISELQRFLDDAGRTPLESR